MATRQGSRTPDQGPPLARRRPFLEIQYHPGNIRRGVRYVFLTRRQVGGWVTGAVLWVAFVVFGLAVMPAVVRNHLDQRRYRELEAERTREGERLQGFLEHLAELETQSAQSLVEMSKIHLAYGLAGESQGQGGYPPRAERTAGVGSIYAGDVERGQISHAEIEGQVEALRVFLEEVRAFEAANEDQVRTTPSLSPLRSDAFVMTSPFGTRRSPFTKEIDFHAGIDLAAQPGTPVYAPADGTVTFAGRFPLRQSVAWWRYGNLVALRNGERFMTLYGHCDQILVKVGQKVEQGDVISTVGDTGWSTNPHLHYEVRWRDEAGEWVPVDPRIYILDHRWRDEERMLIRARRAPSSQEFQPLPRVIGR
jgi:murein DD-endopeptidase MepM/ murein hydrolase activator NlpD